MQEADARAWIAFHRLPGLSNRSRHRLLTLCGHPQQIWSLNSDQLDALALSPTARAALEAGPTGALHARVERDWCEIERQGIQLLPLTSDAYPPLLRETADPPPLLYVKGDIDSLQRPQLAMVGSRRCSRQGAENAFAFARRLGEAGLAVTSGGALGIDTESHRGALAAAGGCSLAVLGTGVDVVYPRRNAPLFRELETRGALVSEFPLGTRPHRALFPQRNRLISGLSLGVLVVEAALQSGSLITARFALEQNREVFALPGSIHDPGTEGCHQLIQQGAKLVMGAEDIMAEFGGWLSSPVPDNGSSYKVSAHFELEDGERALLDTMGHDPVDLDRLALRTGWSAATLQSLLTGLEIRGLVDNRAGRYQRVVTAEG